MLALANLGLWMGYFGPLQVLLPDQVERIDPGRKAVVLGLATAAGALIAVVAAGWRARCRTAARGGSAAVGRGRRLLVTAMIFEGTTDGRCTPKIG